jgi:hypothetical protein
MDNDPEKRMMLLFALLVALAVLMMAPNVCRIVCRC